MSEKSKNWIIATFIVVLGVTTYIIIGVINETSRNSTINSYSSSNQSTNSDRINKDYSYSNPEPVKTSAYKGNQLANGSSPLDGCFGSGRYAGEAWITFKNGNAYDAIVCLVNIASQKTIRNEYIKAGTNFKMTQIPSGTYYLKVYYGNDWNPTKTNFCGISGAFDSNEHFSKSDKSSDYLKIENSEYSYTTGEITLYTVANGNMTSERMSASEFFQ